MSTPLLIAGRVVYAAPFAVFGVLHFLAGSQMASLVPAWIPGDVFWVYLTGVLLLAAAIAIAVNKWIVPAALGLAAMLAVFILTIHLPGLGNPEMAQMAMTSLLKDTALAGGALALAGVYWSERR